MNDLIVAGAVAGITAGLLIGIAIILASLIVTARTQARDSAQWQLHSERVSGVSNAAAGKSPSRSVRIVPMRPTQFMAVDQTRFDESAKRALGAAADEAIRFNHNYIGTEHLLAGIIRADTDGVAGRVLARMGVELSKVRTALEFIIGRGDSAVPAGELTMSPRTQKILILAEHEATARGSKGVGAVDLLLGLVREGEGIASGVLESLGISLEHLRRVVLAELGGSPAPSAPQRAQRTSSTSGQRGPFDRFNDRSKRVLALAQDEAIKFGHNYMGAEHLLIALVREGEGVAARVLVASGVSSEETRRAVETLIGRGDAPSPPSEITLNPRLKKIIELAIDESRKLGHDQIATEHLLLGLLRDGGNNACEILKARGIAPETVRLRVIAMVGSQEPPTASP